MSNVKSLLEKAIEQAGNPSKSDGMIKIITIDGIDVFFKKKFDKETKQSFWKYSKMEEH